MMLKEGDWVEAQTLSTHAVIGYIERMVYEERQVLVRVIRSCCGRTRELEWASMRNVTRLAESNMSDTEGYLLNAIDFALDDGDEQEFFRRSSELRRLRGLRVTSDRVFITINLTL